MDKSFAMGNSMANGNGLSASGPVVTWRLQGWDIRPETSWTLTIGQDPA